MSRDFTVVHTIEQGYDSHFVNTRLLRKRSRANILTFGPAIETDPANFAKVETECGFRGARF